MLIFLGNTGPFEGILRWWQAVGSTEFDLSSWGIELQNSHYRGKRVTS